MFIQVPPQPKGAKRPRRGSLWACRKHLRCKSCNDCEESARGNPFSVATGGTFSLDHQVY